MEFLRTTPSFVGQFISELKAVTSDQKALMGGHSQTIWKNVPSATEHLASSRGSFTKVEKKARSVTT